jgi:prolyl 4-hydroxylase
MYAGHLDLTQPLAWTLDDALSPQDCERYVERLRSSPVERAPVITEHGVGLDLAVRNNTRFMWDSPDEAGQLLAAISDRVPSRLAGLARIGANPRLRLYRYGPGEKHGTHWDTVVEFERGASSLLTLVIYLNDGFEGGETDFSELGLRVTPRRGRALLFQHRILHTATAVRSGEKFVLRTDIVYGPDGFVGPLIKLDPPPSIAESTQ